jgi:hypothetical protein
MDSRRAAESVVAAASSLCDLDQGVNPKVPLQDVEFQFLEAGNGQAPASI